MAFPPKKTAPPMRQPQAPAPGPRPMPPEAEFLIDPSERSAPPAQADNEQGAVPPELAQAIAQLVQQFGPDAIQQALDQAQTNEGSAPAGAPAQASM